MTMDRITLKSSMELDGIEAMKQCFISNLGVAILLNFVVQKELGQQLVALPCGIDGQTIDICYSYHQNKGITEPMKLMMQLLSQKLHVSTT
ncbi:hypothetical protein GKC33_05160 [Lactobacillus salivarius]|uniref:LysR substrate-binding domain-containing protein n=1 Tax=Ligilactobacillus salivarius TaxID=1624 RepID=A0A6A8LQ20_9LACO|nr:LysR family transcriptional regulator substrate-binding protein [Ligilactobacillus salivarius]MSE05303.1 hypothetical protein [Ligilactobacillus salivarius]MSE08125.1 hypothetical protein [Ligilactobacillus salivarius]